jgi:peroxiredoxin Q/BCP
MLSGYEGSRLKARDPGHVKRRGRSPGTERSVRSSELLVSSVLPKVGDPAPEFDVVASDGRRYALRDLRGKKNVVLYFYPKDFTMVCTAETCGFRDIYAQASEDTEVIGVSLDSDESHRKFAETHGVQFPLIADKDKSLTRAYGAVGLIRSMLGLARRVTFVIDKGGRIAGVFEGELSPKPHLEGVRTLLAKLGG